MPVPTRSPGQFAWWLRRMIAAILAAALSACATRAPDSSPAATAALRQDGLFQASPAPPASAEQVVLLTEAMRRFADEQITAVRWRRDARRALMDSLEARGQLRLDYDDGLTRTAAEAFDSRSGNCLSLVIMTAAFAKYLDMPVRYQSVQVREQFTRYSDLTLASGHGNVVLSRLPSSFMREQMMVDELTIDFVTPEALRGMNVRILSEATVLAMFMNNRAVETMTEGRLEAAYVWAREAVRLNPAYLAGINTLGVIYLRAGHLRQAEAALRHVLARDREDAAALGNLVITLQRDQRPQEAEAVAAQLAQVHPYPLSTFSTWAARPSTRVMWTRPASSSAASCAANPTSMRSISGPPWSTPRWVTNKGPSRICAAPSSTAAHRSSRHATAPSSRPCARPPGARGRWKKPQAWAVRVDAVAQSTLARVGAPVQLQAGCRR